MDLRIKSHMTSDELPFSTATVEITDKDKVETQKVELMISFINAWGQPHMLLHITNHGWYVQRICRMNYYVFAAPENVDKRRAAALARGKIYAGI